MSPRGVCELCGYHDDSYRIEENGTVMRVCKLCHDGHLQRLGLSPDDSEVGDLAMTLELNEDEAELSGEELLRIKMEQAERERETSKVPTLDPELLGTLLNPSEDDKKILNKVRQREQRRKKKAAEMGNDDSGEDYTASEELIRSGEELLRVVSELETVADSDEPLPDEERVAPLIAKIVSPKTDEVTPPEAQVATTKEQKEKLEVTEENENNQEESEMKKKKAPETVQSVEGVSAETAVPEEKTAAEVAREETAEAVVAAVNTEQNPESVVKVVPAANTEPVKPDSVNVKEERERQLRERVLAAANQTIDDERIQITSPEIPLSRDERPKTNLDVAISEYTSEVRFLDAFKYVINKISYSVFLALIVLAVSTVLFITKGWQQGLIVLGGGAGAILLGLFCAWYLSYCYEKDRRALLLRIRQQEILFKSVNSDCYRELRTKFTVIKGFGKLLSRLTVLLPLAVMLGGNILAVILTFLKLFWLLPVISAGATVAAVLIYYITKFIADWINYALDRERNQQLQQQTLLDILTELKKK